MTKFLMKFGKNSWNAFQILMFFAVIWIISNLLKNYEKNFFPIHKISNDIKEADILEFQKWFKELKFVITTQDIAISKYSKFSKPKSSKGDPVVVLNAKYFKSDKKNTNPMPIRKFLLLDRLLHEFGHIVLYYKEFISSSGRSTPMGYFQKESGVVVERYLFNAIFAHSTLTKRVFCVISMCKGEFDVPDDWMQFFFSKDISTLNAQSFRVHLDWKDFDAKRKGKQNQDDTKRAKNASSQSDSDDYDDEFVDPKCIKSQHEDGDYQ